MPLNRRLWVLLALGFTVLWLAFYGVLWLGTSVYHFNAMQHKQHGVAGHWTYLLAKYEARLTFSLPSPPGSALAGPHNFPVTDLAWRALGRQWLTKMANTGEIVRLTLDAAELTQTLAAAKWPKLQRLALRIPETYTYSWPDQDGAYVSVDRYDEEGDDEYMDDEGWHEDMNWSAELGGLLDALSQTKLEQLSLTSFASASNLLVALAEHGLPASLQILDLSASDLGDEAVGETAHAEMGVDQRGRQFDDEYRRGQGNDLGGDRAAHQIENIHRYLQPSCCISTLSARARKT